MIVSKYRRLHVTFILRFLFLTASILFLCHIVDFRVVVGHVSRIPIGILISLLMIAVLRIWLTGVRWQMVNPDTSRQLSSWKYFRLMMISNAFNLILPGALGGDFAKMALTLKSVKSRRTDNMIAIVVDRFIGLFSITMLGATSLLFMSNIPDRRPFNILFALLALTFIACVVASRNPWLLRQVYWVFSHAGRFSKKLIHVLEVWRESLDFFRRNRHQVFLALLLCLPIHGLSFVTTYILARTLGISVSFFDIAAVLTLVWVITAIPLTISGAGVREISLIYFLSLYGVESDLATALSVYLYIVSVIVGLVGWLFFFLPDMPRQNRSCLNAFNNTYPF